MTQDALLLAGGDFIEVIPTGHLLLEPGAPVSTPQAGSFPPAGPTTLTGVIPSFLYKEYADDEDLQAFVASYNALANQYAAWFAFVGLPVYTNSSVAGSLLDWVAEGLYGIIRPALSSGTNKNLGPFNTYQLNTLGFNQRRSIAPPAAAPTTDDVFRRIITWNFFKGDGRVFNIRYLKRRVMRFLVGTDGTAPNIDNTYAISVTFGVGGQVNILVSVARRLVRGGALFNRFMGNSVPFNSVISIPDPNGPTQFPNAPVLKEAIDSGVLQLPFQFNYVVTT